jgi:hypothetical protein
MSYVIERRPKGSLKRLVLAVVPFWLAVAYLISRVVQS